MSFKRGSYFQESSASRTLFRALSLKDPYTGIHSARVEQITTHFIEIYQRDFQGKDIDIIRVAARLHDIGKIGISDCILNKPGKLSESGYRVMRKHPRLGQKLIEPLRLPQMIRDVILYHHENYDGSGYPAGLKGTDIPLAARLLRITDYYDALTTDRPYRAALKKEKVIRIMELNRNCFDPTLLSFFIGNLDYIGCSPSLYGFKERSVQTPDELLVPYGVSPSFSAASLV